jgi:quercetin dioxygenase-like cupin family protein
MRKASLIEALAKIQPNIAPALLLELDARHMIGVVRISAADGLWEQHNGGDEILVILQGRAEFTLHYPDTTEMLSVNAGDILHIPKGVAHGAKIHEEVHILFFTPKEDNIAWTEGDEVSVETVVRHNQSVRTAS